MPAARTNIRDRIIALILGDATIASTRVNVGRRNVLPEAATGFPVVYVYLLREDIDTQTMGSRGRHQTRTATFAVDYFAKASSVEALEEQFDTACAAIEAVVSADTDLNGAAQDIVLTSAEYISDGSEEQPFGRAALQYRVTYFSNEP
jgi:hypothetical protein